METVLEKKTSVYIRDLNRDPSCWYYNVENGRGVTGFEELHTYFLPHEHQKTRPNTPLREYNIIN